MGWLGYLFLGDKLPAYVHWMVGWAECRECLQQLDLQRIHQLRGESYPLRSWRCGSCSGEWADPSRPCLLDLWGKASLSKMVTERVSSPEKVMLSIFWVFWCVWQVKGLVHSKCCFKSFPLISIDTLGTQSCKQPHGNHFLSNGNAQLLASPCKS